MNLPVSRLHDHAELPVRNHEGDAGLDLKACEDITINSGERTLVPTGIAIAVPKGHVGLVWDRSGLAVKHGMHCFAGVIDEGYRGEVKVVLQNHGNHPFKVEKGMRIAQLIIQPVLHLEPKEVDSLDETARAGKGFGSSGH
ncbi:MAG: dUTP diphosphatase [Nanoarchaeota archaeon]